MKFGILGAGRIAVTMAETVRRMNESGDSCAELYAVASRDMERAQTFARHNGVQKAFGSYADMLADPALEAVYIATPHSHHYRQIKLCADAGKHVLCEKAFTVNARQAQDALAYARKKSVLAAEACAGGTIPGAVSMPLTELRSRLEELDKSRPVYVSCQTGLNSYTACRILTGNGFTAVNLAGGYRLYDSVRRSRGG